MAKKEKETIEEQEEFDVRETLDKGEEFIENNKKAISIGIIVIIALVGIYLLYKKVYVAGEQKKAQAEMFVAEKYFERDSFRLALEGDGSYPGFLDIIDDYGVTKAGNLSHYYAGVSYLYLGEFDKAISHLKEFDSDDNMIAPIAKGALGDAYLEKGELKTAIDCYMEAAELDNSLTAPIYLKKAGQVYEQQNDYKSALDLYEKIKTKYPRTQEARRIEKYIARAKLKIKG